MCIMAMTEFKDKAGTPLYTGDIVMWCLGKFAKKSGGPSYHQIYQSKRQGVSIRNLESTIGRKLRDADCQYIVIYDKSEREL